MKKKMHADLPAEESLTLRRVSALTATGALLSVVLTVERLTRDLRKRFRYLIRFRFLKMNLPTA